MEILKVLGLNKVYGKGENQVNALRDVSFTMEKGEFAAVVGESGSGKSTLLNCIGGLDLPTAGKVFLDGEDLYALDEKKRTIFRRRNIGFIFQAFHLIGELSVEQNIIFPLLLDRQKPDKERLEELMEVLGIADRRKHLPGQLSGGQMQRVAIGRALIMRPMMILADEPTGNLDSRSSRDVMDLLVRAARHYQQTILMITHNMNLTSDADRVLRVTDGVLKDLGGKRHEKLS
jgi:putative ABC transport system ATP-binding protein